MSSCKGCGILCRCCFFSSRRRHTRFDCDWSSDVCSSDLLRGGVQLTKQLREVQVEDVLGRDPVKMELDRVGAYMQEKVVLVTGAGGSIGSELVRQIARVRPKLLVILDHAEDNLFRIDREMIEERHFTRVESVLADCKEGDRMLEVMQRFRPSVVFHAAAYKH